MVSKKGTRKLVYNGDIYYWFVRKNQSDGVRIHILSEDKKVHLEFPPFDAEVHVTPKEVRHLLEHQGK